FGSEWYSKKNIFSRHHSARGSEAANEFRWSVSDSITPSAFCFARRPDSAALETILTGLPFAVVGTFRVVAGVPGNTESMAWLRAVFHRSARRQPDICRTSRFRFAPVRFALGLASSYRCLLSRAALPSVRC